MKNSFPPPLTSSQAQLHAWLFYFNPLSSAEGWGMGTVVSSLCVVSTVLSFSCSSPAIVGSLPQQTVLHSRVLSTECRPSGADCSNAVSPWTTGLAIKPTRSLLQHGILRRLQCRYVLWITNCSQEHRLQGGNQHHHGLLSKLWSSTWSTYLILSQWPAGLFHIFLLLSHSGCAFFFTLPWTHCHRGATNIADGFRFSQQSVRLGGSWNWLCLIQWQLLVSSYRAAPAATPITKPCQKTRIHRF